MTVDTTADTVDDKPGDGVAEDASGNTSLRAAIMEANALPGADTIELDSDTYRLTRSGGGDGRGDLDIHSDLSIIGVSPTDTIIDGNLTNRAFEIHSDGNHVVSISNLKIQDGRQNGSDNLGGAIKVDGGAFTPVVTLDNLWLTGNQTSDVNNAGGAILSLGDLTITNSLIEGNTAAEGGGVVNTDGTLSMTNVTVSGNTATIDGGSIGLDGGIATLRFVTVADNTGDGLFEFFDVNIDVANSIFAGNSGYDIDGSINSSGNNLIEDTTGGSGFVGSDLLNPVDPKLGGLGPNGGDTWTHALLVGSPAIDAG